MDDRLDAAIKRRDKVAAEHQRLIGRLDAATADQLAVENEIRVIGIEPDQLDQVIARLDQRLEDGVAKLERDITAAEIAIEPFVEGGGQKNI